jgi:hypothetical protein
MSSDLSLSTFNRIRDCVSLQGSWLEAIPDGVRSQNKANAQGSLSFVEGLKHTFGYGAYGYHAICRKIERAVEQFVQENRAALVEHLKAIRLEPKPAQYYQDINAALGMLRKIRSIEEAKSKLLGQVQERFFHHKSWLPRWILYATTAYEALKKTASWFQRDGTKSRPIFTSIQTLFGCGPLGYFALEELIVKTAAESLRKIAQPNSDHFLVIDTISVPQLLPVLADLEKLEAQQQKLLETLRYSEWEMQPALAKGCLMAASAVKKVIALFQKSPQYSVPFKSRDDLLMHMLKADQVFYPLWAGNLENASWSIDLMTTERCHQIKISKDGVYAGHAVFRRDVAQQKDGFVYILAVTEWSVDPPSEEAVCVLFCFLRNLHAVARTAALQYDPKIAPVPAPTRKFISKGITVLEKEHDPMRLLQSVLSNHEHHHHPQLFHIETFIQAAKALK